MYKLLALNQMTELAYKLIDMHQARQNLQQPDQFQVGKEPAERGSFPRFATWEINFGTTEASDETVSIMRGVMHPVPLKPEHQLPDIDAQQQIYQSTSKASNLQLVPEGPR